MEEIVRWFRASVTGKLAFVGALVLVLLIPLGMIEHRIAERGLRAEEVRRDVATVWGAAQVVGGPVLIVPFEQAQLIDGQSTQVNDKLYVLPSELRTSVVAETQILRRAVYEVPVYTAAVSIGGTLAPPDVGAFSPASPPRWEDAALSLPIGDARSIREPVRITVGTTTASFASAGARVGGLGRQLTVPLAELGITTLDAPLPFSISYRIGGSERLAFLPFGDVTRVDLQSDWPSPSFTGAFLPADRSVDAEGFTASWRVLDLGRGYASSWRRSTHLDRLLAEQVGATSFGVDLMIPIGVHETSLRATKYAALFLTLTFLAYFLFELFTPLRLHTFQYLLVGSANVLFYLLLVALSEHVGFDAAYCLSAVGSTVLISGYSFALLGTARRASPIAMLLAAIYTYLYSTLQLEDFALLSGSLALFFALASVMYLTRHVDWHAISLPAAAASGANARDEPTRGP